MKYERRTDSRFVPATILICSDKCVALEIYLRLAELEDKIESGEIVYRNTYLDYLMSSKNISELTDKEIEFFVKHNARVRENTDAEIARLTAWKRRAEVAERALHLICDITMKNANIIVFPNTKTQVKNKIELYNYFIQQAKKEIEGERK